MIKKVIFVALIGALLVVGGFGIYDYSRIKKENCWTSQLSKKKICRNHSNFIRAKNVPKFLINTLVLSEDGSFFSHNGFDWYEIKESFKRNWKEGKFSRGGSTITQQLAKNLYLYNNKSLFRKYRELFVAQKIEKIYSKSNIIEIYLNVIEFGSGIFGLGRASYKYFQKSPSQLTPLESIYIVSLLPSPRRLSQSAKTKKLSSSNRFRMKIINRRLYRSGRISEAQYTKQLEFIENEAWPFGYNFQAEVEQSKDANPEDLNDTDILEEGGSQSGNTEETNPPDNELEMNMEEPSEQPEPKAEAEAEAEPKPEPEPEPEPEAKAKAKAEAEAEEI